MTNEELEELGCNCGATARRINGGGWSCAECGTHISITGRSFKSSSRLFIQSHETEDWYEIPLAADPVIEYTYTELDYDLVTAFRPLYMPRDDNGGDEVSG